MAFLARDAKPPVFDQPYYWAVINNPETVRERERIRQLRGASTLFWRVKFSCLEINQDPLSCQRSVTTLQGHGTVKLLLLPLLATDWEVVGPNPETSRKFFTPKFVFHSHLLSYDSFHPCSFCQVTQLKIPFLSFCFLFNLMAKVTVHNWFVYSTIMSSTLGYS